MAGKADACLINHTFVYWPGDKGTKVLLLACFCCESQCFQYIGGIVGIEVPGLNRVGYVCRGDTKFSCRLGTG